MNHILRPLILSCIVIIGASITIVSAQPDRVPDYEIVEQEKFLEAHKLKMVDKFDKATDLYLEVYKENRENHAAAYELARLYLRSKDLDNAEKYIKKSLDIAPDNRWYRLFYAELMEEQGFYDKSARAYKKIVDLNPNDYEMYEKWALNETKNANFAEAIRIYNLLEQRYGITERTVRKKFDLYHNDGDEKNAILELQSISDAFPSNVNYLNNLAGYYKEIGKEKEAVKVYERVLQIDPQNAFALVGTSTKADITEDTPAYLSTLKTIIQNPQIDIDHKVKELIPYVEKGGENNQDDQMLLSLLEELKNAHPNEAKAHAILGDHQMSLQNYGQAIKSYKKTLELNRKVYHVWEQLMYAQQLEKQYDDLYETSKKALLYFPNQGKSYFFNGLALHYQDKPDKSTSIASEAIYIGSNDIPLQLDCHMLIAKNYAKTEDYTAAKSECQKGLALNENHPGLIETMGDISLLMGDADAAHSLWEKAIKTGGNKARISKKIAEKQIK